MRNPLTCQEAARIKSIGLRCPDAGRIWKNRESGEIPERSRRCDRERTLHLSLAAQSAEKTQPVGAIRRRGGRSARKSEDLPV